MIWQRPPTAIAGCVLAHGAGAGMRHRNMESIANAFGAAGIATLRFDFPFMDAGRKRVDPPEVAMAAIAAAYRHARGLSDLPLFLGGHSYGGRMASHALLEHSLDAKGLIFCAFPLHTAGKPGTKRAAHLQSLSLPQLFLSGTRDKLADTRLLETLVSSLPRAELHLLDTADHGYAVLKRRRAGGADVFEEMAGAAREFVDRCLQSARPERA